MRLRHCYLLLCIIGTLLTYWHFLPWLGEHGLNLSRFVDDLFVNRISGFFALDVIVSVVVLVIFVLAEGGRLKMRLLWLPIVGTLLVGVACGLPLFLYLRQLQLDRAPSL